VQADGSVGGWVQGGISGARVHVLDASPAQFEVLCDDVAEHILVIGSRGSGKSELGARWQVKRIAMSPRRCLSLLVAKRKKARRFVEKKLLPLLPHDWLTDGGGNKGRKGYRKSQDEIALAFRHGCMIDCLSAKVVDDARADDQVGALIDETQLCPSEARENLILSGRRSKEAAVGQLKIQTLETATLLAGEFEEYLERAKADPTYRVCELSVTDNIHLETTFDPVTGVELPAAVLWSRMHSPKERFEQEVGVWDPAAKRFRPKAWKQTGQVYFALDAATHFHGWSVEGAEREIRRFYSNASAGVGGDITAERYRSTALVGVCFDPSPLAAVVARVYRTPAGVPDLVWVVDELDQANNDVTALGRALQAKRYGNATLIPDAAGRYGEGGQSSVDLLVEQRFSVHGPARNAYERDRQNAVNAKLRNGADQVSLWIDQRRCPRLASALRRQLLGANGKECVLEGGEDHFALALGYLVSYYWPAAGAQSAKRVGYAV